MAATTEAKASIPYTWRFENPKIKQEQYTTRTSTNIAACNLHIAQFLYGDY